MPPKKVAALAQAVKDRVTKKTAAAKKLAAKEPITKKSTAKKPAVKNNVANDAATAITADNNPAVAPKRALRSAGKAPAPRANNNKKRKTMSEDEEGDVDEDDKENKAPPVKKAKTTTTRAAAPKKSKSPARKTAAKKTAAGKAATGKATAAEPDVISKARASASKTAGKKRKAAEEDENEDETDAPQAKKAKVIKSKETVEKKVAPKKAAPKKAAPKKAAPKKASGTKRKAAEEDGNDDEEINAPTAKKAKVIKAKETAAKKAAPKKAAPKQAAPKKAAPKKAAAKKTAPKENAPKEAPNSALKIKIGVQINFAPTELLDIFVFGEGSAGELGLGSRSINGKMPIDVKRPRFNPKLSGKIPGVVQVACGGMHGIALTKDHKVLTWGVNDNSALGRNTKWDGSDQNDEDDGEDEEESGLNPYESTPAEIDMTNVAPGTKFVQVAASDSASFALTEDGRIYSWGTFRGTEGVLGFSKECDEQKIPVLLPEPKKIVSIATGSNHVLTIDNKGKIQTWGAYQQNQLGRRIVDRDARASALRPGGLPIKRGVKIAKVSAGSYHSFALTTEGQVYSWGLNNFGELGVEENMGLDGATVLQPTLVESLLPYKIVDVVGGEHHSVALTDDGKVLVWGRVDGHQCGFAPDVYSHENSLYDEANRPRIVRVPTAHETIPGPAVAIAVGTDTSIAITREGVAWSWGFNSTYQAGQGKTLGEVFPPRAIDNSVVRERKILSAGCGGQFSVLASRHEE